MGSQDTGRSCVGVRALAGEGSGLFRNHPLCVIPQDADMFISREEAKSRAIFAMRAPYRLSFFASRQRMIAREVFEDTTTSAGAFAPTTHPKLYCIVFCISHVRG